MKKIIALTISLVVLCGIGASAQTPGVREITTGNPSIEQNDNLTVSVAFDVEVGKKVARSGQTVVYRPYLASGSNRWDLPEIVVYKSRAKVAQARHEWASGQPMTFNEPTVVRGGESFRYSASVPRQGWMKGAELRAEILYIGCCDVETSEPALLASNIDLPTPMGVIMIEPEPVPEPVLTTGDVLAKEHPFVMSASEFDETLPELMFDDDREHALKVNFAVNSSTLDPRRENNAETLALLLDAIRRLEESSDSRVEHVVVAGFASPEGSFRLNDRLAWNRASALKAYITDNSALDSDIIHIYNGIEDWYGLRMLVEASDMADRQAVLDVIESTPIQDADGRPVREMELKKLSAGRTYDYMLRNFFPGLRNASYIKVYYGEK